ncbi:hypothetical protein AALP_AA3G082200 [Arabis alpina]|uniref:Uncharacterized protein n=1 Tax=Arabis alpina TaxID=50452 RepID=A0A087H7U9_ARAAL|nr:hypothetical protein AALP_AA3G082200 [Arabis alpina]
MSSVTVVVATTTEERKTEYCAVRKPQTRILGGAAADGGAEMEDEHRKTNEDNEKFHFRDNL